MDDDIYQFHDDLILKLATLLETEGYLVEFEKNLDKEIPWRPDIFAIRDGDQLAIDIRLETNLDDDFLSDLSATKKILDDLQIYLCIPENIEKDLKFLEELIKREIGLLVLKETEYSNILLPKRLKKIEVKEYIEEKCIPESLLHHIKSLNNLEYRTELAEFAIEYERTFFNNLDEEYQFVKKFIIKILQEKYGKKVITKIIEPQAKFERILQDKDYYRDHFVHSIQVFILGSIIIDNFYDDFNKWYSHGFPNSTLKIDFAWLITSIFHDTGYPIQKIIELNELVFESFLSLRPKIIIEEDDVSFFTNEITELSKLYSHLLNENNSDDWIYNSTFNPSEKLIKIFSAAYYEKDHGVISSLNLLKKISLEEQFLNPDYKKTTYSRYIYPSALSMALHNSKLWDNLFDEGIFPIQLEKFPLVGLLLYCDGIQEWGRPGNPITTEKISEKVHFIELIKNSNKFKTVIEWADWAIAKNRESSYEKMKSCITTEGLDLKIEIKTSYSY